MFMSHCFDTNWSTGPCNLLGLYGPQSHSLGASNAVLTQNSGRKIFACIFEYFLIFLQYFLVLPRSPIIIVFHAVGAPVRSVLLCSSRSRIEFPIRMLVFPFALQHALTAEIWGVYCSLGGCTRVYLGCRSSLGL